MSKSSKIGVGNWIPSKNLSLIANLCVDFNKGKVYEIFWEYCDLTAEILSKMQALCWLYYEDSKLSGFALGRLKGETFVAEEIWGPCDGMSNELGQLSRLDMKRTLRFKKVVASLSFGVPIVIRAATDNQFAHLIARTLGARWMNGLIISERTLNRKFEISTPTGYRLRMFTEGDQFYMSKIHKQAFGRIFSPNDYKTWTRAANYKTIMATYNKKSVGFIIAEKRRCGSLGDFTIVISPAHQKKGIGSALLKAAFNIFVDMGVKRVIADYLILNTSANRLYQKHKFKPKRVYNYFLYQKGVKNRRLIHF